MAGNPIGMVLALTPTDKLPGVYLQTTFGVGGNPANQVRDILLVGAMASGGGTLVPDAEVKDVVQEGDEVTLGGNEGCEIARMVRIARRVPGIGKIKIASPTMTSGAAATATITIDGTWTTASTGPLLYRIGGQSITVSVLKDDTPEDVATAIGNAVNAKKTLPVTAAAAAGVSTEWVVTLTEKSYGVRGNSHILWQDVTQKPSGLTSAVASGASGGTVLSSVGPWGLANSDTLVVAFNAGGNQTFTISATAAARETTNSESTPYALSNGMTLTVKIDRGTAQSISFLTAEFVDITNATAEEVAAVINAKILGAHATVTSGGTKVTITSDRKGTGSYVEVTGGTANASGALNFATAEVQGTGNVSNVAAVTAAEWVTIMAGITNGTAEDDGGALRLTSATTGSGGTAQVVASSTADDEMGFDNAVHNGSAAGASVASGGVRFTGGAGTEDLTALLDTLAAEPYWTIAFAQNDSTNLARIEDFVDTQAGPLVRQFSNAIVATTGTLAAASSLAQSTLDNVRHSLINMEEGETPSEEMASWIAAVRHIREQSNPNQDYDLLVCPFVPQEAVSKRPSRASQVTALDAGVTIVATKNNKAYIPRMITTRSLTDAGGADDGTIDVGQARTPDVVNELLGALWTQHTDSDDPNAHHYIRNDPAPGEEADVPAGITFPALWKGEVTRELKRIEALGWIVDVDLHPVSVTMHPTSSTPHFVMYAPVVVSPIAHQLEGTIAQTKFTPS